MIKFGFEKKDKTKYYLVPIRLNENEKEKIVKLAKNKKISQSSFTKVLFLGALEEYEKQQKGM